MRHKHNELPNIFLEAALHESSFWYRKVLMPTPSFEANPQFTILRQFVVGLRRSQILVVHGVSS